MGTSAYRTKWLVYSCLCAVADTLDSILSAFSSEIKPDAMTSKSSDVDSMTDEQIKGRCDSDSRLRKDIKVWRLSPGTVGKSSWDPRNPGVPYEANALCLLHARTNIPVPRVRRVIKTREHTHLIVMDYIKGPTLAEVWSTYSLWRKICVAIILRRYVRQLHRVEASSHTPPGPVSEHGPRRCDVPSIFGERFPRGPFASYKALSEFMNDRYQMWFRERPEAESSPNEKFDDSSPLVFTHNDLNPRNIIVGDDGRLWVVDCAWSGFYPRWFEFCAMTKQVRNEKILGWQDHFWELMIPFVCRPYFKQQRWLSTAGLGLCYK